MIRIVILDNQSLWADEALTAYEVRLPFGGDAAHGRPRRDHAAAVFRAHLGLGEGVRDAATVALRSLSAIAGVALVPIAYLAARELVSRRAGLVAAALVAVNPFMIWYSQEARAYMLLAALTGASFLYFVRARERPVVAQPRPAGRLLGAGA